MQNRTSESVCPSPLVLVSIFTCPLVRVPMSICRFSLVHVPMLICRFSLVSLSPWRFSIVHGLVNFGVSDFLPKMFKCPECEYTNENYKSAHKHIKRKHSSVTCIRGSIQNVVLPLRRTVTTLDYHQAMNNNH